MRSVTASDGQQIAIHELGGSGRPTLLCHATGFHGAVWEPLAAQLGPDLERWAIDFRAHGASTITPGQPLDWPVFVEDVLGAVDGLGLEPGTILGVGHSMGGAGLVLAERARPPGVIPATSDGPNPLADGAARRRASFPSHAEALANYAAKPPLHDLRADALHAYVRHGFVAGEDGEVHLACRPVDESRIFAGGGAHDAFAALPDIACPVVIGAGDGPGPGRFAPAVVERLPRGRLQAFPHLGHFGPLEAPTEIAAAIRAFAAEL